MEQNLSGIMFTKAMLATFVLLQKPGKYLAQVFNNVTENALVADEETGDNPRYIINLRAIAPDQLVQLKEVFKGKEEVPIEETNGLFLTCNAWLRKDNKGEFTVMPTLPVKGEEIEVIVGEVLNREQEPVWRVISHRVSAATKAAKLDVVHLFEEEPAKKGAKAKKEETLETSRK